MSDPSPPVLASSPGRTALSPQKRIGDCVEPPDPLPDREVWERLLQFKRFALKQALRYATSEQDAEDLCSEAMIRAFEGFEIDKGSIEGFYTTILHNLLRNWKRRRVKLDLMGDTSLGSLRDQRALRQVHRLDEERDLREICFYQIFNRFLDELTERNRAAFVAILLKEATIAEVAERTGRTYESERKNFRRIRARLRQRLREAGYER